jgi:hypothetical protein
MLKVKLKLSKPYYENYLRFVFNCPSGPVIISRNNALGKFISSQISESYLPVPDNDGISLSVPIRPLYALQNKYLYFTDWRMRQINDAIEFYIDFHIREYSLIAEEKRYHFKTMYELFLSQLNLENNPDYYEMFKKRNYRRRKMMSSFFFNGIHLLVNQSSKK